MIGGLRDDVTVHGCMVWQGCRKPRLLLMMRLWASRRVGPVLANPHVGDCALRVEGSERCVEMLCFCCIALY